MDLVGVVIPVLDRPDLLQRAVDSVLRQEDVCIRLVVVDDGSTADLSKIEGLVTGSGHTWLRLEQNRGPAEARNRGVSELPADCDWVAFLDSDDTWRAGKLSAQVNWHSRNPVVRISQVNEEWFRDGIAVSKPPQWVQKGGDLFSDSVERCSIGPSCVMLRRDLWKESGGFDPRYRVCEDYELWLRITSREEIGLVGQAPLVCKHGGEPDQLSVTTAALDRYRIVALLELLASDTLTENQRRCVVGGILRKAAILEQGARKRDNRERANFYRRLRKSGAEDPLEWIERAWRQCD